MESVRFGILLKDNSSIDLHSKSSSLEIEFFSLAFGALSKSLAVKTFTSSSFGSSTPCLFKESIKSIPWSLNIIKGSLSISLLTIYTSAAKCLQGTAKSGQEHFILMSWKVLGKRLIPKSLQIVSKLGSRRLLASSTNKNGDLAIASNKALTFFKGIGSKPKVTL